MLRENQGIRCTYSLAVLLSDNQSEPYYINEYQREQNLGETEAKGGCFFTVSVTFIFWPCVIYAVVGFRNRTGSVGKTFPSSLACSLQQTATIKTKHYRQCNYLAKALLQYRRDSVEFPVTCPFIVIYLVTHNMIMMMNVNTEWWKRSWFTKRKWSIRIIILCVLC